MPFKGLTIIFPVTQMMVSVVQEYNAVTSLDSGAS